MRDDWKKELGGLDENVGRAVHKGEAEGRGLRGFFRQAEDLTAERNEQFKEHGRVQVSEKVESAYCDGCERRTRDECLRDLGKHADRRNRPTRNELPDKDGEGVKTFLDMIAPGIIKFEPDYYVCGNTYRCTWAIREYPTATKEQALLRHLGEKEGVTLKIEIRQVTPKEERRIIANAANKTR